MEVVVKKRLDGDWATEEEFAAMTDAEIIELIFEDLSEFVREATWEVVRPTSDSERSIHRGEKP